MALLPSLTSATHDSTTRVCETLIGIICDTIGVFPNIFTEVVIWYGPLFGLLLTKVINKQQNRDVAKPTSSMRLHQLA
jgi:hypothetical protein